jgi:CDP-diacylglycerol--glycerol-3-phosphate 3-phosphatidyltransferase
MNPPNALTLSRFFMAGLLMICLSVDFPFARTLALLVFVVAGITDAFDGWLARAKYGVTPFGALMDPLADKVLVCAAFISFVEIPVPGLARPLVPAWVVVLIISREFLVTGLRLLAAGGGRLVSAGVWGKQKTIWQMIVIGLILAGLAAVEDLFPVWRVPVVGWADFFAPAAYLLSVAVAAITAISGAMYFYEHRDLLRISAR